MKLKFGIYLSAHTHPVCDVCVRALAHAAFTRGVGVNAWRRAWCWRNFSSANGGISQSDRLMQIPNPVHATPEKYVIGCCNYDGASAPRFRHALRQALTPTSQSARTHTSHTGCVCALRSLGHGCVQEVKNDINTVRFLTTNRSFRVLGHQCVVYDGELFNFDFSVHVLFPSYRDSDLYLPLYDWQTRTVWPKNIKIGSTEEKRHLHLGCPWGKLIDNHILISKWTIPLSSITSDLLLIITIANI